MGAGSIDIVLELWENVKHPNISVLRELEKGWEERGVGNI